ncbi:MAG: hypothetical protein H6974_14155 [Gammaproteobacteria bacterium]|nr:hypothetical protein [Gammaproteobacteria bacterium]
MNLDNTWASSHYGQAVLQLFARIGAILPATLAEPVRAILVGGAAVHVLTRARISKDVEAIFSRRILLPQDLLIRYTDEQGLPRQLAYDYNYFSELGLLHPDAEQDAIPLGAVGSAPLVLAVLHPVDLAVSKLARFQDQDRQDMATLASKGMLTAAALEARVSEALNYYVGNTRWIQYNLKEAVALITALNPRPPQQPTPGRPQPT